MGIQYYDGWPPLHPRYSSGMTPKEYHEKFLKPYGIPYHEEIQKKTIKDLEDWVKDIEADITTKNGEIQERERLITEMEMEINRLQNPMLQVESAKKGNEKARDERDRLMSRKEILDQIVSYRYELEEAGRLADTMEDE